MRSTSQGRGGQQRRLVSGAGSLEGRVQGSRDIFSSTPHRIGIADKGGNADSDQ